MPTRCHPRSHVPRPHPYSYPLLHYRYPYPLLLPLSLLPSSVPSTPSVTLTLIPSGSPIPLNAEILPPEKRPHSHSHSRSHFYLLSYYGYHYHSPVITSATISKATLSTFVHHLGYVWQKHIGCISNRLYICQIHCGFHHLAPTLLMPQRDTAIWCLLPITTYGILANPRSNHHPEFPGVIPETQFVSTQTNSCVLLPIVDWTPLPSPDT